MHPPLAQPARALRHVAGLAWPCRNTHPAVSQRTLDRVAGCVSGALSSRPCARCCVYRSSLRCIVALPSAVSRMSRDTTQRPSCPPVTIQFIVSRHTPLAARSSRERHSPLCAGRPCHRASRPCRSSAAPCRGPFSGRIVDRPPS